MMHKKHNKKDVLQYSLDELFYGEEEDEGTELDMDMKSADPQLQKMLALAIKMRALHSYDAAKAEAFKKCLRARLLNEFPLFSFFRFFSPVKFVPVYATILFFLVAISFSFFQYQKHSTINNLKTMIADLSTSSSTFVNNEIDLNKAFDTVELEDLEFLLTHKNLVESELTLELLELSYDLENFDTESSEEEINTVTFDPHLS